MKKVYTANVLQNVRIAEDIYQLELQLDGFEMVQAGQFVNVYLDDKAHLLPRPISICKAEDDRLTLVYRIAGVGTAVMAELQTGDTLRISSPLGNGFTLPENGHVLLVGGGVGIPPLLGTAIAAKQQGLSVTAAHGYRSELFLDDAFSAVADSLLIATDDGSHGYHGTVVALLETKPLPADTTVLACGPKPMLHALANFCKEHGLPLQVSLEERMGCGFGACVGCVCKLNQNGTIIQKRVCKDGPIFDGSEVIFE